MSFCTAINCMDGRTQEPVNEFLKKRFTADFVDTITEPGPNRILATHEPGAQLEGILNRVMISVERHHSVGLAVVGHHDCAGNPAPESDQRAHTAAAVRFMRESVPSVPVIGLWVGPDWSVEEMEIPFD